MADSRAYEIQLVEMLRSIGRALGASGIASSSGASIRGSQSINLSDITAAVSGVSSRLDTLNQYLDVLSERVTYDQDNDAWKITGNLYATGFLTAGGVGGGGGGGGDATLADVWRSLTNNPELIPSDITNSTPINALHIPIGAGLAIDPQTGLIKVTNAGTVTSVAGVSPVNGDVPAASLVSALGLSSALKYRGVTTTDIVSDPTANPVIINGYSYSASSGDVVVLTGTSQEYMWNGSRWGALGDESSYALKTVSITGTGYLTGGGTLEQSRTIDIASNIKSIIDSAVPNTRTVNGHALSSDVTVTKGDVGLGSVENVAISTWAGSNNITTLGTITTGVWNGTAIANAYLANSAITIGSTTISLGGSSTSLAGLSKLTSSVLSLGYTLSDGTTESTLTWDSTYKAWKLEGNFYATGFITAGGVGSGGGGGGGGLVQQIFRIGDFGGVFDTSANDTFNAYAINSLYTSIQSLSSAVNDKINRAVLWASLQNNDIVSTYDNYKIDVAHIPDMAATYGYLKSTDLSGYVTLGTAQSITGAKTFNGKVTIGNINAVQTDYLSIERIWYGDTYVTEYGMVDGLCQITQIKNGAQTGRINIGDSFSYNGNTILHASNYSNYALPLSGGTMSNTNLVTNLNADLLDGYHENSFLRYRSATWTTGEATLWNQIGIKSYYAALPDELSNYFSSVYGYGEVITLCGGEPRFEIYVSHQSTNYAIPDGGGIYVRSGWNSDKRQWKCLAFTDSNVASATNSDLLDGREGSAFAYYGNMASTTAADLHTGIYRTWGDNSEMPYTRVGDNVIHCFWDTNAQQQLYLCYDRDEFYFRRKTGGTWQSWKQIAFLDSTVANADTVDNRHADGFAYSDTMPTASSVGDIQSGIYATNGNQPDLPVNGAGNSVLHCNWDTNAATELFFQYSADAVYFRRKYGSWQSWVQIYHSGNSNLTTVPWACSTLTVSGGATIAGPINLTSNNQINYIGTSSGVVGLAFNYTSGDTTNGIPIRFFNGKSDEIVRFTEGGNVGIGTPSPQYELDVTGVIASRVSGGGQIVISNTQGNSNAGSILFQSFPDENINGFKISSENQTWASRQDLVFYSSNNTAGACSPVWSETMRLTYGGNVGIGNPSPSAKLHVSGTAIFDAPTPSGGFSDFAFQVRNSGYWTWCAAFGTSSGSVILGYDDSGDFGKISCENNKNLSLQTNGVGKVSIGTSSVISGAMLTVAGNIECTGVIHSTTGIFSDGYVTAGTASDIRLKENVNTLNREEAKRIVMGLRPVTFSWNSLAHGLCEKYEGDDIGFIAQEVQPLVPQAIGSIFNDYLRMDSTKFIAPLVSIAQSHESRLDAAEREIVELKRENAELKARLNN